VQGQGAPGYREPAPVTMFRAAPAPQQPSQPESQYEPEAVSQSLPVRPPYSIIAQSQRDAEAREAIVEPVWNPASREDVVAPPMVASGPEIPAVIALPGRGVPRVRAQRPGQPYQRSAMQRIFQDTRTSITYDMPEALADSLPWVDRDRKAEPFERVLARVADDLTRAAQSDPEWALGAKREIRDLSKRLDRLPEPPPLQLVSQDDGGETNPSGIVGLETRPFRPRPIWPGASGRPEAQIRPVTIITDTGNQTGPRTSGLEATYVPSGEDATPATTTPRRSPAQRRTSRTRH
jgi:hypothetical protein